jgi:hypothetical protein
VLPRALTGSPPARLQVAEPPPAGPFGDPSLPALSGILTSMADGVVRVFPTAGTVWAADDATVINTAFQYANVVRLVEGLTYSTLSPVVVPPGKILAGMNAYRTAAAGVIKPAGTFAGAAALTFTAATPAGAVQGITLDGSLLPVGTVDGIACTGACKQGSVMDVNVHNFPRHGINVSSIAAANPDGWYLHKISSHDNAGLGVSWDYAVDGQMDTFHVDHNTLGGVAFGTMNNFAVSNGKCQQNTGPGYSLTGGFIKATITFSNCHSENNGVDGWDLTGANGQGTIVLAGCHARDDGTSGASGSGFSGFKLGSLGNDLVKQLTGCSAYITASAAGPDFGLSLTGDKGRLVVEGGMFAGSVAGFHDGGGNTASQQFFDNTITAIGQYGSLGTYARLNT